ncbi:MAG: hypothetical protein K5888_00905 [Lachnospiraceae bacterium]|nr:hypothetical protein [Lachnospiraceae bacterium]
MITVSESNIQINTKKALIGYDLGNTFSQISYIRGNNEPISISLVAGTEQYNIPTVLAKRNGIGQWYYGKEALKSAGNGFTLVDDLLNKAIRGEEVLVEDEMYDPVALLTLFVKRSLSLLGMHVSPKDIDAFIFTTPVLDARMVEVLGRVVAGLNLKCDVITYQSHVESFYSYMLHQPKELWQYQVMAFEYNDDLTCMRLEVSENTKPKVVLIHAEEVESFKSVTWPEDEKEKEAIADRLDAEFLKISEEKLSGNDVTTVYLLGDGFKEGWAKESLKSICRNRRVFQGNNLYSKGACYSINDKLHPSELSGSYVFLGEDKLKSNIGMKALRRGEDSYFAVLDAGTAWFEARADFDMILEEGNEFSFLITSLTGGHITEKTMVLDGLPQRPRGTTRLGFHVEMSAVNTMEIEIVDKGFGQIIKPSGRAWNLSIVI